MLFNEYLAENIGFLDEDVAEVAFQAAYSTPALRNHLCSNPFLPPKIWEKLFKRPSLSFTSSVELCARKLTPAQKAVVLSREKRDRPLQALLDWNTLTVVELEKLLSVKSISEKLAEKAILQLPAGNSALAREFALAAGGLTILKWLAKGDDVDDESAREMLSIYPSWMPVKSFGERNNALKTLLERVPTLIDIYAAPDAHESLKVVAAGSRFITDETFQLNVAGIASLKTLTNVNDIRYILMALINNPVTTQSTLKVLLEVLSAVAPADMSFVADIERRLADLKGSVSVPFDQVTDQAQLVWLERRSMPSDFKPMGRPEDLATLAVNPHLPADARKRMAAVLSTGNMIEALGAHNEKLWDDLLELQPELREYKPLSFKVVRWDRTLDEEVLGVKEILEYASGSTSRDDSLHYYLSGNRRMWVLLGEKLAESLGAKPEAWEIFLSLTNDQDRTVEELIEIALAI